MCFGVLFDFLLLKKMNQTNCITFCVKSENKSARTFEILIVEFVESTMSRMQIQLWYKRFKKDLEDVNDTA